MPLFVKTATMPTPCALPFQIVNVNIEKLPRLKIWVTKIPHKNTHHSTLKSTLPDRWGLETGLSRKEHIPFLKAASVLATPLILRVFVGGGD